MAVAYSKFEVEGPGQLISYDVIEACDCPTCARKSKIITVNNKDIDVGVW